MGVQLQLLNLAGLAPYQAERVVRGRLYPRITVRTVFDSNRPDYALPVKTNGRSVNLSRAAEVDPDRAAAIRRERIGPRVA